MDRQQLAAVLACACMTALAPLALASPRCTKTCRRETAACTQTQCAGVVGTRKRGCLETCPGTGRCAAVPTLAYVVSKCTADAFHQTLQVRHGECDPITVLDFPEPVEGPLDCALVGSFRFGYASSPILGAFQRMGVSRDGRHVVFEVTDDFAATHLLPPGQQNGIFIVRADGRGLRRLGPASRDPSFRFASDPAFPIGLRVGLWIPFTFSRDGGAVVLTDLGPGPAGEEAVQIFTLDVVTGERKQLTHLPVVPD